ncbi:MAG: response regulator transcription factor [Nocardioidaceae bacterium]
MKLLVVEDEVRLAQTLRRGLVAEGFMVDLAHDGIDALWMAESRSYDTILLDLMLPKVNGYDVCRRLREQEIWTPVLVLTAKDGEYDQADALDLGADDYLVKPFSFVVLVARVRALMRRNPSERPSILEVGDLRLDPATRTVHRSGERVSLTPREFALLHLLMRRRDVVVSKSEILTSVWDSHYDGDDNVVEVYISYLRKKIDHPFGRHSITTVRGAGYGVTDDSG